MTLRPPITIDGFRIDVTVQETYTLNSEVTKHPVESGADVTDHVRALPIVIGMDCIVSDTPVGDLVLERDPDVIPSEECYAHLRDVVKARGPITIETVRGVFDSMVLRDLEITESAANGDALRFRVVFEELVIKTNRRTTVKVSVPRAAKKVNLGAKTALEAGLTGGAEGAASGASPTAGTSSNVKKGYQDSWLGQLTDFTGITN